jgi:hypothetical protein
VVPITSVTGKTVEARQAVTLSYRRQLRRHGVEVIVTVYIDIDCRLLTRKRRGEIIIAHKSAGEETNRRWDGIIP